MYALEVEAPQTCAKCCLPYSNSMLAYMSLLLTANSARMVHCSQSTYVGCMTGWDLFLLHRGICSRHTIFALKI